MPSTERYEILDTIAHGDYAVVYRARDTELNREVAIKQIHEQYLLDPKQLDSYWQEAQLLASLEHPYVMTIYDIVRERGWLILELMQGSLKQKLGDNPIDLEDLRLTLTYLLHGLQFLESNGIIHGDVKPTNLMLDKNHRVKLGDFGIARRLQGDDGSVVKGTTKYMAPEVVSDQFGPVGPHSDLYSLGFSAYELMCGSHFESLFPGLNMFARDQQIAWMMWHSAPDRKLPDIDDVLEGVPSDLSYVIQKLTNKDPHERYQTAEEAINDLRAMRQGEKPTSRDEVEADAEFEAQQQKKKRRLLIGAMVFSVCLSVSMMFMSPGKEPRRAKQSKAKPTSGVIEEIDKDRGRVALRTVGSDGKESKHIIALDEHDRIFINGELKSVADLQLEEDVTLRHASRTEAGEKIDFVEIEVTRAKGETVATRINSIDLSDRSITFELELNPGETLVADVPRTSPIWLNDVREQGGEAWTLGDLQPGDDVQLTFLRGDEGITATAIRAKRITTTSGVVLKKNDETRELTFQDSDSNKPMTLPLAERCVVTINGADTSPQGGVYSIHNLQKDDRIELTYDAKVQSIQVTRESTSAGEIVDFNENARTLTVRIEGEVQPVVFRLGGQCELVASGSSKTFELGQLRVGDKVSISHQSVNLVDPVAERVEVAAVKDAQTWAVVVGFDKYDDPRLASLVHTGNDVAMVEEALSERYRVPDEQMKVLLNASRTGLERDLSAFCEQVPPQSQFLVYVGGHVFVEDNVPYLATKDFALDRVSNGMKLDWIVSAIEATQAAEKVLLVDSCLVDSSRSGKKNFSAAEQVSLLKDGPTRPVSSSVDVIASCSSGQFSIRDAKSGTTAFAQIVADALSGEADADGNHRLTTNELFSYLDTKLAAVAGPRGEKQAPWRFLPNANPARLTEETKEAVETVLAYLDVSRLPNDAPEMFNAAASIQVDQPDAAIAAALVLMKHNRTGDALKEFEQLRLQYPDRLVPYQAIAWRYLMLKRHRQGVEVLRDFVSKLPREGLSDIAQDYVNDALQFSGVLREFALSAVESPLSLQDLKGLDDAVLSRGDNAKSQFAAGVMLVRAKLEEIDRSIAAASSSDQLKLRLDRKRLTYYAKFNYAMAEAYLKDQLER